MANYTELKASIDAVIKSNGNNEITGPILNNVLNTIVASIGANRTFAGFATPSTNPTAIDANVFFITTTAGVYTSFNNLEVKKEEISILTNDINNNWSRRVLWAKTPLTLIVPNYGVLLRAKSVVKFDFYSPTPNTQYGVSVIGWFSGQGVIFRILDDTNTEIFTHTVPGTSASQPTGVKNYKITYSSYYLDVTIDWDRYEYTLTDILGDLKVVAKDTNSQEYLLASQKLATKYDSMMIADKGLINYPANQESILKAIRKIDIWVPDTSKEYGIQVIGYYNGAFQFTLRNNTDGVEYYTLRKIQSKPTSGVQIYEDWTDKIRISISFDWSNFTSGYTSVQGELKTIVRNITDYSNQTQAILDTTRMKGMTPTGNNQYLLFRKYFPIVSLHFWAADTSVKYAFTNIVTRVGNQTFFTINNKNTNTEVLRLAVTEDQPTSGIRIYEKYDSVNKFGLRVVYDWSKYIPGSGGSDGNMQIEIDAFPYSSQERMLFNNTLNTDESVITTIVATRNSQNYNSIRELMRSVPASASNKYRIFIPKGRWCEVDLQGRKYVELVGEDMYETILYINGNDSNISTPSDYSFGSTYSNKPLNEIPQHLKHIVMVRDDFNLKNVTMEADNAKYCIHIDSNIRYSVNVTNCVLKDLGYVNYCVGIGIWSGQILKFNNCKFVRNNISMGGIFLHNWNNQNEDTLLEVSNSKFIGCNFIMLSELGSERNDIVNLVNCYSTKEGKIFIMVDNTSNGTTYWTNPDSGEKETDPLKLPYSIKLNAISSNVQAIEWVAYLGTPAFSGNPRPNFISRSILQIDSFNN